MNLQTLIRIEHVLLLKLFIYIFVMADRLIDIFRESFLDHVFANLDKHAIRTAVVLVLPTSQKRVAYRLIGTNCIVRGAISSASPARIAEMRSICTKQLILSCTSARS